MGVFFFNSTRKVIHEALINKFFFFLKKSHTAINLAAEFCGHAKIIHWLAKVSNSIGLLVVIRSIYHYLKHVCVGCAVRYF